MSITRQRYEEIKKQILLGMKLQPLCNPFHNAQYAREVVERLEEMLAHLGAHMHGLGEDGKLCMSLAALFHDFGHCGETIRQQCAEDIPRKDISNEEYASLCAVNYLKEEESMEEWELQGIRELILATSVGQGDPHSPWYRPHAPLSIPSKLLSFADIGGFRKGFDGWMEEGLHLLRETPVHALPADFEQWKLSRRNCVHFIGAKLEEIAPFLHPEYADLLRAQLKRVGEGIDSSAMECYEIPFGQTRTRRLIAALTRRR